MLRVRRQLHVVDSHTTGDTGDGTVSRVDDTVKVDDESEVFTANQLVALNVSGWLVVLLYTSLAVMIVYMTVQHFRHHSSPRKRVFHLLLLTSVMFNVPDPLEWIFWPEMESWKYTYTLRIYSLLLQSVCKSFISIAWSEVVSAGQSDERRKIRARVKIFNGMLVMWAIAVPCLLTNYTNDVNGQYNFMKSTTRGIITYAGAGVNFVYGLLLTYQGMRVRRRLLIAKGTVPVGSVEKSLNQLMLTVYVIVFSDILRIGSLMLNELKVDMPMITFLVCNNLIPNILPTICMLYLMRKYSKSSPPELSDAINSSDPNPNSRKWLISDTTWSQDMTDEHASSLSHNSLTPVLIWMGSSTAFHHVDSGFRDTTSILV